MKKLFAIMFGFVVLPAISFVMVGVAWPGVVAAVISTVCAPLTPKWENEADKDGSADWTRQISP